MSSSSPNAGTRASAPLVDGIVNHVLLQSGPDLNQSLSQFVHVLHFFSDRRDLASLHKSCNLLGWDLGYSEATDQVRWMQAFPVAAAWLSCMPCAPVQSCWNISQGSVATYLKWGEIFINNFIAQFLLSTSVKELWKNWSIFSKDMDKSIVSPFLTHVVVTLDISPSVFAILMHLARKKLVFSTTDVTIIEIEIVF